MITISDWINSFLQALNKKFGKCVRFVAYMVVIVVSLLLLVSCGAKNDVADDTEATEKLSTSAATKEIEESETDEGKTGYFWPSDAPENSAVITVFSQDGRKCKIVDDVNEVDYIIDFFESLEKTEIEYDKKGGQTVAVVINTSDVKKRWYFIGKDKLGFSGTYKVDESSYYDFLSYYEKLACPEYTE